MTHHEQAHRRLERGRKVQRFLRYLTAIGLACGALYAAIYFGFVYHGPPREGDCLSGLTEEYAGFPIVACDDPSAAYEIVNYVTGERYDHDLGACDEHPDGELVKGGGGKRSGRWEFCAVPLAPR